MNKGLRFWRNTENRLRNCAKQSCDLQDGDIVIPLYWLLSDEDEFTYKPGMWFEVRRVDDWVQIMPSPSLNPVISEENGKLGRWIEQQDMDSILYVKIGYMNPVLLNSNIYSNFYNGGMIL